MAHGLATGAFGALLLVVSYLFAKAAVGSAIADWFVGMSIAAGFGGVMTMILGTVLTVSID